MTTKDQDMSEQSNEMFTPDSAKHFLNELGEHVLAVAYPDELAAIMNAARAPLLARIAELEAKLDVDYIAQVIRMVDGNNSMGAGALAEAIVAAIRGNE